MDTSNVVATGAEALETLATFFRDYRAEWKSAQFDKLFVEPPYMSSLTALRPTFLEGGRGTGKTVALRSMRYTETIARHTGSSCDELPYYGIYTRINQNRIRAFHSPAFSAGASESLFVHYLNLVLAGRLCELGSWLVDGRACEMPSDDIAVVSQLLGYDELTDFASLGKAIRTGVVRLQMYVNNPGAVESPLLSPAEAPITELALCVSKIGRVGAPIFICIDEYENLSEIQQRVINTYIKHAEEPVSYKIGVKRFGRKTRNTFGGELLESPADYDNIDASSSKEYAGFARNVAHNRLLLARHEIEKQTGNSSGLPDQLERVLPTLTFEEEALKLGTERRLTAFQQVLQQAGETRALETYQGLSITWRHFIAYWAARSQETPLQVLESFEANPPEWKTRFSNFGYESLFWLSQGRKGTRFRKYYTGWATLFGMSSGNIRYLLELLDRGFTLASQSAPETAPYVVGPMHQTLAARNVGQDRLEQLESLTHHGVELKRIVLAIGKVFMELARNPLKGSPEANSFVLSGEKEAQDTMVSLLNVGVSHLAFEVSHRTKATSSEEMRDGEYRLHPIFAPFFEYSHRKKRRITVDAQHFLLLGAEPKKAIAEMLRNRPVELTEELPEQLSLYEAFYEGRRPNRAN